MPALFTLITPGELLHSNSNNAIIVQDVWKYFEHLISPDLLLASICFEHGHLWNELKSIGKKHPYKEVGRYVGDKF